MARQRIPIQTVEAQAIKAAEAEWLRWREIDRVLPADITDRQAFTKLRKAAEEMQAALAPFVQHALSRQAAALVSAMQEQEKLRAAQHVYREMIDAMVETLQLIERSAESLIINGRPPDEETGRWVFIAADAWVRAGLPEPTAKGRFFKVLDDEDSALDLHWSTPEVTPEKLQVALKQWRDARALRGGKKPRHRRSK